MRIELATWRTALAAEVARVAAAEAAATAAHAALLATGTRMAHTAMLTGEALDILAVLHDLYVHAPLRPTEVASIFGLHPSHVHAVGGRPKAGGNRPDVIAGFRKTAFDRIRAEATRVHQIHEAEQCPACHSVGILS